ncbi:MAG TPA: ABC transporter substrate-binding protein [Acidimicrobiales bacterium]|nr:ABC transporter substrate-binding protein [Acidimicrobiales bacterium]
MTDRSINPHRFRRRAALAGGLLACGLVAAACGSSGSGSSTGKVASGATTATTTASGGLASSGSSGSGSSGSGSGSSGSSGSGSGGANVSGVTLSIGDQAGTGAQALLQAAGLIDKLPFKVKWHDFTSGPPILQAMNAGSVDVGGVGNAPPIFAAAGGAKIDIVGAVKADNASGALLVPAHSPIHSVSQLKGQKIAVEEGTSGDAHLLNVLNQAGISVKDVTIDNLQPADGLAAFSSGSVNAWDVWSPYIEEAVQKDHARVLVNWKPYGGEYSFVVASKAALASPAKAAAIKDYVKILNQAYRWSDTHTATWAKLWGTATGLSIGIMDQAAKDTVEVPVPITAKVVGSQQDLINEFAKAGLIPKAYSFSQYSYSGFNSLFGKS